MWHLVWQSLAEEGEELSFSLDKKMSMLQWLPGHPLKWHGGWWGSVLQTTDSKWTALLKRWCPYSHQPQWRRKDYLSDSSPIFGRSRYLWLNDCSRKEGRCALCICSTFFNMMLIMLETVYQCCLIFSCTNNGRKMSTTVSWFSHLPTMV